MPIFFKRSEPPTEQIAVPDVEDLSIAIGFFNNRDPETGRPGTYDEPGLHCERSRAAVTVSSTRVGTGPILSGILVINSGSPIAKVRWSVSRDVDGPEEGYWANSLGVRRTATYARFALHPLAPGWFFDRRDAPTSYFFRVLIYAVKSKETGRLPVIGGTWSFFVDVSSERGVKNTHYQIVC